MSAVVRGEELRIALVMNGGVSLAVWMGGVTNEIARVVTEAHPVYRHLLELTRTSARVDVICGTSAGGVNGAALSLALQFGTEFGRMRELWQEKGAFLSLLRPASASSPPSLLDGEGYFLPALQGAFEALQRPGHSRQLPLELVLPTTLLHAKAKVMSDDLGSVIQEAEHRGQFHFSTDDFTKPHIAQQLARAARSSASFPIAFEPSFCPVDGEKADSGDNFNGVVDFTQSRYLLDGGLLDNKPFEAALKHVFGMEQQGPVRRVLAYIVPDPGITASTVPDEKKEQPPIGEVALASVFGIPTAETINQQIDEIRAHNRLVGKARQDVVELMRLLYALDTPGGRPEPPTGVFNIYRRRRLEGALEYILDSIEQSAGPGLGRRTRTWLTEIFIAHYRDPGIAEYAGWVPTVWPELPFAEGPADEDGVPTSKSAPIEEWPWGLYPVEFFASIILDLLRRGERFQQLVRREHQEREGYPELTATTIRANADPDCGWDDPDFPSAEPPQPATGFLARYWTRAYELVAGLRRQRRRETASWGKQGPGLLRIVESTGASEVEARQVMVWLRTSIGELRRADAPQDGGPAVEANRRRERGELALKAAALAHAIQAELAKDRVAILTIMMRLERPLESAEASRLLAMLDYLDRGSVRGVLDALVAVEVFQYALGDRKQLTEDVMVEFVQISGACVSPLGSIALGDKLAGLQLGHFSAFYKASWRANDWMHGRIDGSERLVRILLSPDRLQREYAGAQGARTFVYDAIRRIAVDDVPSARARSELDRAWSTPRIQAELAFLDDLSIRVPDSLPLCCEAVARRLHLGILHEEMPEVVKSVRADQSEGAPRMGAGAQLADAYTADASPADLTRLWRSYPLGKEKVTREFGTDLLTRTVSQTVVVAQAALSSESSGLGPIRVLLGVLRLPVRLFDLLASQLLNDSKTASAVTMALTAVGLLLVGLSLFVKDFPELLGAFGWSLTGAGMLLAVARAPYGALAATILLLVGAFLLMPVTGAPAVVLSVTAVLLVALWRLPAIVGGLLLLLGAVLWSLGSAGRDEALYAACSVPAIANWIGSVCPSPIPPRCPEIWTRVLQTGIGAGGVLLAWIAWWLASALRHFDRWFRRAVLRT